MSLAEALALVALAVAAGLAAGSYGAVVADRGWAGSLSGRSHCDCCLARLRWFELVPVASLLAQHGRCRHCGARIPRTLLASEAGAGALAGVIAAMLLVVLAR